MKCTESGNLPSFTLLRRLCFGVFCPVVKSFFGGAFMIQCVNMNSGGIDRVRGRVMIQQRGGV